MKYEVTRLKDGRVDITVHLGTNKDDKSMGVTMSDPGAVKVGVDILTENLLKEIFGFTPFDLRMAAHTAFSEFIPGG